MTDTDIVTRLFREWFEKVGSGYDSESEMRYVWDSIAALVAEECAQIAAGTFEGGCSCDDDSSGYDYFGENSAEAIRDRFVHSPKPLT